MLKHLGKTLLITTTALLALAATGLAVATILVPVLALVDLLNAASALLGAF